MSSTDDMCAIVASLACHYRLGVAATGTYPEVTEFIEAAMRRVGASNVNELGDKVGMTSVGKQRELYKWWRGQHRPLITNVIPLMRATGMLSAEGEEAVGEPASSVPAPGSVEAALALLTVKVDEGLRDLQVRVQALETQPSRTVPRKPARKRRAS
jgi:hypothetical protein